MSDLKLGQIIEGEAQRDAIHVAVAPVVCGSVRLMPGDHVGLTPDGMAEESKSPIGIVDPFLKTNVMPGEKFWLLLYQQTVTGMRHEWQHPAFPAPSSSPSIPLEEKNVSEAWIKAYVKLHCPYSENAPDGGYAEFLNHVVVDRWIFYNGSDCHGLSDVEDADELFRHLSVVLGRRIDASYFEAFTCTC